MTRKSAVTVVGGGVSGMTAGLILARFGHEVTVVERAPVLGQAIRGFFRDGVYFDTGMHHTGGLGENGPFTRYLQFLGLGDLPLVWFDPEDFETIRFGSLEKDIRLTLGYENAAARLHSLFPDDERGISAYFDAIRKVYKTAPFLDEATDIRASFAEEAEYDTLAVYLKDTIKDPTLRAVLSVRSLLCGAPPTEVSFLQHARAVAASIDSAATFAGGGRALADGFVRRLEAAGVNCITGNGVARVNFSSAGRIEGVTLDDGSMFDADTVIYTGHPCFLFEIVHEKLFAPMFVHHMQQLAETPSAYMLFGRSDTPVLERGYNLFYCPETDLAPYLALGRDPFSGPFYVATRPGLGLPHGTRIDDAAWEGHSVAAVMFGEFFRFFQWKDTAPGQRGPQYAALKKNKLDQFHEALVKACPEMESVRFLDGATPLTIRDYIRSPSGSIYGRRHTLMQYNPQSATRIPGLWLAGQSTVTPGIFGAVVSAFLACGFIVGAETLHAELNR